ncbi:TetR family transcriptional regulator [Cupriavidus gilardii]|uniref:TetR family transcriptional regulator n=1 Tax=Cupriavidus gilardii TaxID=82541 RepID=UPI00157FFDF8|nr:TetR family transcriptional regulator [Cupriavidus gilardii]QQE07697.1 TetR family transcriptional regulator [Cupriavidus sp. ISTL7]MCT9072681.1 TetR family transcriptional regulator [Cupriavidus gilardii]MCT9118576.1 TetR family transcriptional regulator [Cupriavidus gilardii]QKS63298.1 TetR family transcriptional regulator [Cupriavidus gilardii]UXC34998.1 TetR family transcriptional regulator [Cupriavidus gilardii]
MSNATKTKRDPEGTRRRIMDAATEEFAKGGLAGARVDQIARRAETNERMLYYYYGSKEGLFLAVLERQYAQFRAAEERLQIGDEDPVAAVRTLARFVWDWYYQHPEFIRLVNSENLHEARHLKKSAQLHELVNPVVDVLAEIVRRGQLQGVFRDNVDVPQLYLTISALGYYVLSNRYTISAVIGRDVASQDEHERFAKLHTDMLLAYLARR